MVLCFVFMFLNYVYVMEIEVVGGDIIYVCNFLFCGDMEEIEKGFLDFVVVFNVVFKFVCEVVKVFEIIFEVIMGVNFDVVVFVYGNKFDFLVMCDVCGFISSFIF